jgi:sporulation protein YlmC with PRC-barrel domain
MHPDLMLLDGSPEPEFDTDGLRGGALGVALLLSWLMGGAQGDVTIAQAAGSTAAPQAQAPGAAAASRADQDEQAPDVLRAQDLIGKEIMNSSATRLGTIADLVTDDSGEVIAIVDRSGGGMVGVPLASFEPAFAKSGAEAGAAGAAAVPALRSLTLRGDPETLVKAPVIEAGGTIDANWMHGYREHFREARGATREPGTAEAGRPGAGDREAGAPDVRVGEAPGPESDDSARGQPWRLRDLSGGSLRGADDQALGSVDDVAIAFPEGRVAYMLVSADGGAGRDRIVHGVALDGVTRGEDGRSFRLRGEAPEFGRGRGLDGRRLPRDPDIRRPDRGDDQRDGGRGERGGEPGRGQAGDRGGQGGDRGGQGGGGGGPRGGSGGGAGAGGGSSGGGQGGGGGGGGPKA